ncbi:MAG: sialate O-acetylesterase [Lentisphaeria bacterium]|nr:sialate O-acetylesterase [Lentisphaeria bacterium]
MKKFISIFILFAVSLTLFAADAVKLPEKSKFKLVLLIGQSNMAGRGFVEPADKIPHPRVVMLDRQGNWVPAVDPVHFDKRSAGVGLCRTFANQLAEDNPDCVIGLIPAACGGSSLVHWKPGIYFSATKSYPYDDAVNRAKRALKDGTLTAILFHQGEADSRNSRVYHQYLSQLIDALRNELGARNVPFIIGQLSTVKPMNSGKKRVDAAHRLCALENQPAGFVPSDGLTLNPDKIHFDRKSLIEFGKRYYKVYKEITSKGAVK